MCMNVDLPEPEGPTMVTNSPPCDVERHAPQGVHRVVADVILLRQIMT